MIIQGLVSMFVGILVKLLDFASFVSIPTDVITVLSTATVFGSYVVGSDIMVLFGTSITSWIAVKLSIGLALQVWKLLPFT